MKSMKLCLLPETLTISEKGGHEMMNTRHIVASLVVGAITIIASIVYSTSALTLDVEEMQYLTASLASCSCATSYSCGECARSGSTWSMCEFLYVGHVGCTGDGATQYDLCGCLEYSTDCGGGQQCYDEDCWTCDDPEGSCWGCTDVELPSTWCSD